MFVDSQHLRKSIAGACMFLAPLFALAAALVAPERKENEAAMLTQIGTNADRYLWATLLGLVAVALAIPAVLGLMHMLRERAPRHSLIGGGLAILGLVAFAATSGMQLVMWKMGEQGGAAMVSLLQAMNDATAITVPLFFVSLAFALGMAVLAMGLIQAHAVHVSYAVLTAIGAVTLAVSTFTFSMWVGIAGSAILFVGLAMIGRLVYSESDADWDHTPAIGAV